MKKILIAVLLIAPAIQAASNEAGFDLSALARTYLNNANTAKETPTNAATSNYFNQNSIATLNNMLNETPDAFKNTLLDKLPTSLKIYLVKAIEFLKPYLNEQSIQSLQRVQNILQQNIAATTDEHTAAFQHSEQ